MEVKKRRRARENSYCVNSVKAPPKILPIAAPKGPLDDNVANAKERAREGGNAWTRMPIWITELIRYENGNWKISYWLQQEALQRHIFLENLWVLRKWWYLQTQNSNFKGKWKQWFFLLTFWESTSQSKYRKKCSPKHKCLLPSVHICNSTKDEQETTLEIII